MTSIFQCLASVRVCRIKYAVLIILSSCLLACGGGSEGERPTLFINAGVDREATELSAVSLSAQVQSDSDSLAYSWTSSPSVLINHPDRSVADASFVAPEVTQTTAYTFTVQVSDGAGNTATDQVVINITPLNEAPVANIQVEPWPGLDANVYPAGETLVFDASGSSDPDNSASDAIIAYEWQQLAGEDVLTDVVTDAALLTIATPISAESQQLQFRLTVTDVDQAEASAEISIFIQSQSDTLPLVDAGLSHDVFSGEIILLNGVASTSVPSAEPLSVVWQVDTGDAVFIDQSSSSQTYAIAPSVATAKTITFSFNATDAYGNVVADTIDVNVEQQPLTALNDTGVTQQATTDTLETQYVLTYPGQDGQRGQDVIAQNGMLEKAGRGQHGFDFTRLNQNGDEVDDVTQPWRCVRDNITGLVWEIKSENAGLHSTDNTYSWYQEDASGGFDGELNGADTQCTLAECNTTAYAAAVNAEGLCGFFDWRLPNHNELLSIVHFGAESGAVVDTDYFPATGDVANAPIWYWTVQPNADGVQDEESRSAWAIDFASGVDNFLNKEAAAYVRLVRAGRTQDD
ncbi:DUF1566 domain-containing protein [Alteromonas facilis]|uniref:Lcl C-terminal domain-containing protein n=1 Tax=Alteromonas facilis TaxID=2048004 RepID=UPI000C28902B|nr:DUF1566 domain-containing protein [Alteromonas facilis]